ncbi:hypothetical protein BGW80DRAFT_1474791 [Lactifluus volemus]|nr:hypothetical protein BGW80DRAFT_1474791 [Lactifluus volemus]
MDTDGSHVPLLSSLPLTVDSIKVFPFVVHLQRDVIVRRQNTISSLCASNSIFPSMACQLTASDVNFAVVRPLVFKYARIRNPAIVYVCLVVRSHFIAIAEQDLAFSALSFSRAILCEILAMKLVHHFASNQIELVSVLTTSWSPLAGASDEVIDDVRAILGNKQDQGVNDIQSALEMAISSSAKRFVACPIVQSVVNDIYSGRVIYSSSAHRTIVADNYKPRTIEIYDSRNAPWLNHYRLRVPRYGAILEFLNFACLFVTFILCLSRKRSPPLHNYEILFIIFAAAFALEEYTTSIEHGWGIYIANMWNVFDTAFIVVTALYLILRVKGLLFGDPSASDLGFDILACGACILFPRLAFFLVSNNVVILALRAMTVEFGFFMFIASICFSGLLFTLWTLASDSKRWSVKAIAWLMVQIWFGNTSLSFGQASSFHPFFGPILMVGFSALSNTLLLTILISILSNTFARIDTNANQEHLFQFTITTLEGMKSGALISYQPPFNLLALVILWPASWVLSPRRLHSANVFLIRVTSIPILLTISLYERYVLTHSSIRESVQLVAQSIYGVLPRPFRSLPFFDALMGSNLHDVYEAIFDVEPDLAEEDEVLFADREEDRVGLHSWTSRESGRAGTYTPPPGPLRIPEIHTPDRPTRVDRRSSSFPRSRPGQSGGSPRTRKLSLRPSLVESLRVTAEAQSSGPLSPLAPEAVGAGLSPVDTQKLDKVEEGVRRVQELLEDVRELPVRQARIEGLLLMLTRGMRHEAGGSAIAPSRYDTM